MGTAWRWSPQPLPTLDFNAKTFSLVVSGGTGKYRSRTGQLVSTPAARLSQRLAITLSLASSAQPRTISLASVPTAEQFLNHADDRQRGYGNNPFGNFYQSKARTNEQSNGPFPGDQAWDGHRSMRLACGEGRDFPAGDDPDAEKAALEASYCDPRVREPFIAALALASGLASSA